MSYKHTLSRRWCRGDVSWKERTTVKVIEELSVAASGIRPMTIVLAAALALLASATVVTAQENGGGQAVVAGADSALQPGDVVRLRIWMEPDLSGEFAVDNRGVVVLPRVGPVTVTSESAESLRARLRAAYGEFLNHTSIDVSLLRRVQVLGAVRSPGLYQVDPTMNISDVLAMAGGATNQGRIDQVELIRNGQKVASNLSPFTRVGASPIRSGDQLVVPEKSWIARNPGMVVGAVSAALSFTLAILR
jgi:protein involved in polysaccharide export with SLBB domain